MHPLSSIKASRPKFFATKIGLRLAALLTTVLLCIFFSTGAKSDTGASIGIEPTPWPSPLLFNGGFEFPLETFDGEPHNWSTDQWRPGAQFFRDSANAHSGAASVKITATELSDAWYLQEVTVEPETHYMLTGWIKTENVSEGAGANLSLIGTWTHSAGLFGTNGWTRVSMRFNSGSSTRITIGARLGYWTAASLGTAWFDDLRLTPIKPDGTHPSWKILVLIYDKTDAVVTDTSGVTHHMVAAMTPAEVERAALAATQFVDTDIPALTSGNMIPELTIRYPDHALTQLEPYGQGWWPSAMNTAPDRDPAFDSVIVIWDPRVVDQYTGTHHWIGGGAGLTTPMGTSQTYSTIIIEATGYGHRNVFKHEWGHSILSYFEALGTSPKPTVTNHVSIGQYVHWPTGDPYVWVDETDANPIPNSIYNNESGFTHDYYSGSTATAEEPTRRLGITPEAWLYGGPVTAPGGQSSLPPVITCRGNIVVDNEPGACAAKITVRPPTVFNAYESNFSLMATRSDGAQDVNAPYYFGQTVVTWTVTNPANATSTCQQVVTVIDEEPPRFLFVPVPVTVMTGPGATSCGVVVDDATLRAGRANYAASFGVVSTTTERVPNDAIPATSSPGSEVIAVDNCSTVILNRSGVPTNNLFPIGETLITYTATDARGNVASVTQIVTVIENTPPVISRVSASPLILWPPNHGMLTVTVDYDMTDNCGTPESWLTVSSNQPGSSSDWEVLDAHHVRLRAARSGRGERLYTVTINAEDGHGNVSTQNVTLRVPQGMGQGGAKL